MEIGDNVRVKNKDSLLCNARGVIDDFQNLKLRGDDDLILIRFRDNKKDLLKWFLGKELEIVKNVVQ